MVIGLASKPEYCCCSSYYVTHPNKGDILQNPAVIINNHLTRLLFIIIKEGRKELKRYGVLFTCMASRAVHIEVADTLETDSFFNALHIFVSRRGPICKIRSDQGTNFVGARTDMKAALQELDHGKIRNELQRHYCDWFTISINVPSASLGTQCPQCSPPR